MLTSVIALIIGLALAAIGHRHGRLQMRAIGVGLAVFGGLFILMTLVLG